MDYKKEAKELLNKIRKYYGEVETEQLIKMIEIELKLAHSNGVKSAFKEAIDILTK